MHSYTMTSFTSDETIVLKKLWEDLTKKSYSDGIGIDINVFKTYTKIDGFLGDRLFAVFDKDHNQFVSLQNFIHGLETIYFGPTEKQHLFLFNLFDIKHHNIIEKRYMKLILNSIPHAEVCTCVHIHNPDATTYENWTNNCICNDAFCYEKYSHDYLTFDEFSQWILSNNLLVDYIKKKINYYVPETIQLTKRISINRNRFISSN